MPLALPVEVYEDLEAALGKEGAKRMINALDTSISQITNYKWATTKQEILDAMRREFITKEIFEERINILRYELIGKIEALYEKTEKDKAELLGKIEKDKTELLGKMEKDKTELIGKIEALYEKTEKDKTELLGKIEKDKAELLGKMEALRISLERKMTIMFIVLMATMVFLNQNALEFILKLVGLIK